MCGCDKHENDEAACTCICPAHENFQAAYDLARERWDVIVELTADLEKALEVNAARDRKSRAEAWDEGQRHGYQDAQAHHGNGIEGAGCGPDVWDCDCPNPYRENGDDK